MSAPTLPLSIGGAARAAKRSFERRNPVTGEVATRAAAATIDDANAAAEAAALKTLPTSPNSR